MLSPAFDVNPTEGDGEKYLSCAVDFDERLALPQVAIDVCGEYRLTHKRAIESARGMADVLERWLRVAEADGISQTSISRMASCFESAVKRLRMCK